ncbi:MAG: 4-hydroxy-3-methylbut-2-enyl diphosphate reductase [Coriobacteriales bacterium]|nr:4-hydroxy-3-methylbut-2-enyl diphosphate reductase [Coriobacteriales bacterium]
MKILVAEGAGACFGVKRAIDLTHGALKKITNNDFKIYTYGPLIHNPRVVQDLENKGVYAIKDFDTLNGDTVIIRSHGAAPQVFEQAKQANCTVIDATCPYVKAVQKKCLQLSNFGYEIIIIGQKGHPEVDSIYAQCPKSILAIVQNVDDLPDLSNKRVGVVVQTTQTKKTVDEICAYIKSRAKECKVENSICDATSIRQKSAGELSQKVDLMLIIGGINSANTTHLYEICKENCPSYHIESVDNIDTTWFSNANQIGITAGASTPFEQISEVKDFISAALAMP